MERRLINTTLLGCLILVGLFGCQGGGRSFQVDRAQRELDVVKVDQATGTNADRVEIRQASANEEDSEKVDLGLQNEDSQGSGWTNLFFNRNNSEKRKRLRLPRTDLLSDDALDGKTALIDSPLESF